MLLACGCMSGSDLLLILVLYVVIPGLFALVAGSFAVRWGIGRLARAAQRGKFAGRPLSLYCAALLVPLSACVLFYAFHVYDESVRAVCILVAVLGVLTCIGFTRQHETQVDLAGQRLRGFWLQDIVLAVLSYGIQATLLCAHVNTNQIALVLFGSAISALVGFAIAWDVARRSPLGERPRERALLFGLILLTNPIAFSANILAWFMWRRALRRARIEQAAQLARTEHVIAQL